MRLRKMERIDKERRQRDYGYCGIDAPDANIGGIISSVISSSQTKLDEMETAGQPPRH